MRHERNKIVRRKRKMNYGARGKEITREADVGEKIHHRCKQNVLIVILTPTTKRYFMAPRIRSLEDRFQTLVKNGWIWTKIRFLNL